MSHLESSVVGVAVLPHSLCVCVCVSTCLRLHLHTYTYSLDLAELFESTENHEAEMETRWWSGKASLRRGYLSKDLREGSCQGMGSCSKRAAIQPCRSKRHSAS